MRSFKTLYYVYILKALYFYNISSWLFIGLLYFYFLLFILRVIFVILWIYLFLLYLNKV